MKQPKIVVIGSLNMDIVTKTSRFPQAGETLTGEEVHFIPGGKGANQAVAAARLGAQTTMIGAVGNDAFGSTLLESLQVNNISVDKVKVIDEAATGVASVMLTSDDNMIIVVPGANALYLPSNIEQLESVIKDTDIVLLQLEIPIETVEAAAVLARKHNKLVILNPAPAQKLSPLLLNCVDVITPNRSELELLTGYDTSKGHLKEAMEALLAQGPKHVVTTLGEDGAAYKAFGKEMAALPSHRVPVVDTTGAGDAFNAGLAYALATGNELHQAIKFASQVSALAVTKFGAQEGMPTFEEVETFAASLC
ncbi:ribokinase [Paenibacillus castaneae]|uniref:ribokinase n=1 Tax=Paenibacillus castaneae TaxID=474957 RepID=UPI000C9AD931|nr:ribokinase [Paenibacillus castaneae]NIK76516.1 ribokinase [Paenibacillus castaneae]